MHWRRPLTGIERWHWLFARAAPMNLVLVARVRGRFDQDRLRAALAAAGEHYPSLTARIEPGDRPWLVGSDLEIPLRVEAWQQGAWRAAAVRQVNERIPMRRGPLMRVAMLDGERHSDLLLVFHQAVVDGLSGALILNEVLSVYGGGPRAATVAPEVLAPPLDGVLGTRLAALATTLREIPRMRRLTPLPAARGAPPEERRTALLDASIPAAETARLAARASAHGSSVHGALAAAMLLAIGAELRGREHTRRLTIGCATSVDLRRRTDLPTGLVGQLLSRVVGCHEVRYDTLFWDLAADVSGAIRQATADGSVFAYARMKESKAIGVSDAALARRVGKSERFNRAAAIINNLGELELYPRYGDVTLERVGLLVSANAYVGSSLVLSAATCGDATTLNFSFADPLLEPERAQRLVDGTLERLQEAAAG